jgi:hypothetical protein
MIVGVARLVVQLHRDVRRDGARVHHLRLQREASPRSDKFTRRGAPFSRILRGAEVRRSLQPRGEGGQTACPFWRRLRSSKGWATKCATRTIPPIASVITFATISDLTIIRAHFPNWRQEYRIGRIVEEIVQRYAVPTSTGGKRGI